jgi:O-antigen ligase
MIRDRPMTGFGWFRFGSESGPYYTLAPTYPLVTVGSRVHNVFLSNGVELGVPVTLAWLGALLAAAGGTIRRRIAPELDPWRIGMIGIAVSWLVVSNFTPLGYPFPNHLLWLWAGVGWATPSGAAPRSREGVGL